MILIKLWLNEMQVRNDTKTHVNVMLRISVTRHHGKKQQLTAAINDLSLSKDYGGGSAKRLVQALMMRP